MDCGWGCGSLGDEMRLGNVVDWKGRESFGYCIEKSFRSERKNEEKHSSIKHQEGMGLDEL